MSSKLTWHFGGNPSNGLDDLRHSGAKVVKLFDWESDTDVDALRSIVPMVVYRKYFDQNYDGISPDALVAALPAKLMGKNLIWEACNEPVISTVEQAIALSNWYVRFGELMRQRGEQTAAYSFSTGNPPVELMPYLADGMAACDYLAVHEYLHPVGDYFDQVGRYKELLNAVPAQARRQVLVTEGGCDSGGCKECGWSGPNWKLKPQQYLDMLATVDAMYAGDDWVIADTIFTYGGGWKSFELAPISKQFSQQIAAAGGGVIPPKPSVAPTPPPQPVPTTFAEGIDCSHWQGTMDWKVAASKVSFAFIKATQGNNVVDGMFATNWAGAKAAGLLRGAYHYFRNGVDPLAQAELFVKTCGGDYGELPLALDYEDTAQPPDVAQARLFLQRVQELTGRPCCIYTGKWYWKFPQAVGWASDYDLWIASYTTLPSVPSDWKDWTFWQYSSNGSGADYGASSALIDLDRFHGGLAELKAYSAKVTGGVPVQLGLLQLTWDSAAIQELYLNDVGVVGSGTQTFPITTDAEYIFRVVAKK